MSAVAQETGIRTFYTRSPGLQFWAGRPKRIVSDGQTVIEDGPRVEFHPIGDGWGQIITGDPEIIAACEKRRDTVHDVFDPEVYNRESVPLDQRASQAEDRASKAEAEKAVVMRELEEKNRLIAKLRGEKHS